LFFNRSVLYVFVKFFFSNFQDIIGKMSGMNLQGFNLLFEDVAIFLKIIEKRISKKIQKEETKNFDWDTGQLN